MKINTDGILLGAWSSVEGKKKALDIGTGSGVIAIMLAQRSPHLLIDAVEIEESAARQAQINMMRSPFASRLITYNMSIQEFTNIAKHQYDCIVTNPPYFTGGNIPSNLQKAGVRHTISLSHDELLSVFSKLLTTDGAANIILPFTEGLSFIEKAASHHLSPSQITKVYPKVDKPVERLLIRLQPNYSGPPIEHELIIHNSNDPKDYTPAFATLVRDFYLFM